MGLAGTWAAGALGSGPLPLGRTQAPGNAHPVIMPVITGAGAFGLFYGAARLARHIPPLNRAIGNVLHYADHGSTPLVLLTACANAVAEELFFRGALWSVVEESHPAAKTTLAYAATTGATRNPALVLAGTATSMLFGLQRQTSGGILAPALTHLTWSLLMLRYLPPLFPTPRPGSLVPDRTGGVAQGGGQWHQPRAEPEDLRAAAWIGPAAPLTLSLTAARRAGAFTAGIAGIRRSGWRRRAGLRWKVLDCLAPFVRTRHGDSE